MPPRYRFLYAFAVQLPLEPPIRPMLAKPVERLPEGDGWLYEPKWDGFRVLLFRDDREWLLQSRDLKPLNRYFPELESTILEQLPSRAVVDGEVVIAGEAALARWDRLCEGDEDLRAQPFADRRARLERALAHARAPLHVTPITRERAVAANWFERFEGAGLDGVMAKPSDAIDAPGKRTMLKVKHQRALSAPSLSIVTPPVRQYAKRKWQEESRRHVPGNISLQEDTRHGSHGRSFRNPG